MKSIGGRLGGRRKQSREISGIGYKVKQRNTYFFYIGGSRIVNN